MKRKSIHIALAALILSLFAVVGCTHTDKTIVRKPFDKKQLGFLMHGRDKDGYWQRENKVSLYASCEAATKLLYAGDTPEEYRAAAKELVGNIVMWLSDARNGYIRLDDNYDEPAVAHARSLIFLVEAWQSDIEFTAEEKKLTRNAIVAAIRFIEKHQHPVGCWYDNYIKSSKGYREYGVTMLHIHALKAARKGGFAVNAKVLKRGEDYIKRGLATC